MIYSLVFSFAIQSGRSYKSKSVKDACSAVKTAFLFSHFHFRLLLSCLQTSLLLLSPIIIRSCFYCILLQYAFNQYSLEQQDWVWVLSKRKGFRLLRACLMVESNILELMWQTWMSNSKSSKRCQLKKKKSWEPWCFLECGGGRKGHSGRESTGIKGDAVINRNAHSTYNARSSSSGVVDAFWIYIKLM